MKKYYVYHSFLIVIFAIVLIYCLMNRMFLPVLVVTLIEIPLLILNYKKIIIRAILKWIGSARTNEIKMSKSSAADGFASSFK